MQRPTGSYFLIVGVFIRNCAVDDGSKDMRFLFRIGGNSKDESILEGDEEDEEVEEDASAIKQSESDSYWQKSAVSWDTDEGLSHPNEGLVDKVPSK